MEAHAPDWSAEHLGRQIRAIRTQRGLRLRDLAEESGLSASFLSQVEQGQSDISVGRLMRISQALHVHLTDLVELPPPDRPVVRTSERVGVPTPTRGLRVQLLAPSVSEGHTYAVATLAEGTVAEAVTYRIPGSEYFVYLLDGEASIEFTNGDRATLGPGDSVAFLSEQFVRMENVHHGDTSLVWVAFPARP